MHSNFSEVAFYFVGFKQPMNSIWIIFWEKVSISCYFMNECYRFFFVMHEVVVVHCEIQESAWEYKYKKEQNGWRNKI